MEMQSIINYNRIETAIDYITRHFKEQPGIDQIASVVHLSPAHFKRMFAQWAGTSPKRFLQYISLGHAKKMLVNGKASIFDTAYETGFSSTSRLHDLFVRIEGMSPGEYKNGGQHLRINYSFETSPFGTILIASTAKGICHLGFERDKKGGLLHLTNKFPKAEFEQKKDLLQQNALSIFQKDWTDLREIKLHLKATDFQISVWHALLKIPMGQLLTYGDIAIAVDAPKAARAVGTAIASNPIAYLIPCHRVIRASGNAGDYRWGASRKKAIIGWEAAKEIE